MERTTARIFPVIGECYRYVPASGLRGHLECSQIPIVLKLLDDHGFEIHASSCDCWPVRLSFSIN
jgi:hypothetical protein